MRVAAKIPSFIGVVFARTADEQLRIEVVGGILGDRGEAHLPGAVALEPCSCCEAAWNTDAVMFREFHSAERAIMRVMEWECGVRSKWMESNVTMSMIKASL